MNVKRTAYVLLALAKGYRTVSELIDATTLPKEAVLRILRDHAKKLETVIEKQHIGDETYYTLKHWGMLDADWLQQRDKELAGELGLPHLDIHQRNTFVLD